MMKRFLVILGLIIFCNGLGFGQDNSDIEKEFKITESQKIYLNAYRDLLNGTYDQKKKAVSLFAENYSNNLVIDMCIKLLKFYYKNEKFIENDERMYKNDMIAEELIKVLDKSDTQKAFPVLLDIVSNPKLHRQATVKAAWNAMQDMDWQ